MMTRYELREEVLNTITQNIRFDGFAQVADAVLAAIGKACAEVANGKAVECEQCARAASLERGTEMYRQVEEVRQIEMARQFRELAAAILTLTGAATDA